MSWEDDEIEHPMWWVIGGLFVVLGLCLGTLMIVGCSVPATVPAFGDDLGYKYKVRPDSPAVQPIKEDITAPPALPE